MAGKEVRESRRIGFATKVLGRENMRSHDARRWQSDPSVQISVEALYRVLDYVSEIGIRMYRMSSNFVPYATHPDLPQFHGQLQDHASQLRRLGRYARSKDVRLSVHPSQFVVLNAEDETTRVKARCDIDHHARLLDAMEQGAEAVVVLHVGGLYGDKKAALERFLRSWDQLSEPGRRRLVIENDEICFTVEDCLWLHERTGTPVVFDHQHHRLNPGPLGPADAARRALATWPAGRVPKLHFSSPRLDGRMIKRGKNVKLKAPLLRQHADYVDPWTFAEFMGAIRESRFDVMIEAKAKDLAVLRLQRDLRVLGMEDVLDSPDACDESPTTTG